MKTFESIKDIDNLPVESTIIEAVKSHLYYPFKNKMEADEYWKGINCRLYLLTAEDNLPEDDFLRNQLLFAIEYPEWEVTIEDKYTLTLSIISDNGQGIYLLFRRNLDLNKFMEVQ
ncbi:hypothetical protein [uncultured Ferrimonas sp.]|uniref:hypothetical protein n=1 Tax=uncultured Ferrimonas sp. TaxID=432640 RepID=UPI00260D04CA|nr:hypothetical protein [uncultured Ferrimonas sp.]